VHGGKHSIVRSPEVAEVVVSRVLASKHGTRLGHLVLD